MSWPAVGGRKFAVAVIAIASATALTHLGKINDGVYSAVMLAAIAAYITGNVAQKATAK